MVLVKDNLDEEAIEKILEKKKNGRKTREKRKKR